MIQTIVLWLTLASSGWLVRADDTSWTILPRTLSRYDKLQTRSGDVCLDYNDSDTYGYQVCDDNASCATSTVNGNDYVSCTCDDGWDGTNGAYSALFGSSCTDIDECSYSYSVCHANATCTNTDGSYTCSCNQGWYGDGSNSTSGCVEIGEMFSDCDVGYYNTDYNTVCRKFFELDCQSNGTVSVTVSMTYVNNLLTYPYNLTQGLVEVGFLDSECTSEAVEQIVTYDDGSTEQQYVYAMSLNECGFRTLRDLSGYDYFDNAIVLTSPYLSNSTMISTNGDYTMFRFQCVYNSTENVLSSETVVEQVDLDLNVEGHYEIEMHSYRDANFSLLIDSEMADSEAIYVKIATPTQIAELERRVAVESCWMNDYEEGFDKVSTLIIDNFCVEANYSTLVTLDEQTDHSSSSFRVYPFLIDQNLEQVWITCSVQFQETSTDLPDCSDTTTRRKRSAMTGSSLEPSVHTGRISDKFKPQHGPITKRWTRRL